MYDGDEREFRGFGLVYQIHRNDPALGQRNDNVSRTTFLQDSLTKGKVERIDHYAGDFLSNENVPLVSSEANVWLTAGIGAPSAHRTQVYLSKTISARDYQDGDSLASAHTVVRDLEKPDPYGNVHGVRTYDYDDTNCVAIATDFAMPLSGSYVYNKPSNTTSRYGATRAGGNPASCGSGQVEFLKKWFFYDGLTDGNVNEGDVTTVRSKVATGVNVEIEMVYDAFGNVTETTDERGNATVTQYDTLGIYAVYERNAAGHERHTAIDYRWGKPTSVRDANDQFTCFGYDEAGRPKYVVRPLDSHAGCADADGSWKWETYHYDLGGMPANPYSSVEIRRREPGQPSQYISTVNYFDALARPRYITRPRVVETDAAGDCGADEIDGEGETIISGDTVYDAGGRPVATFDPYRGALGTRDNGATLTTYGLNSTPYIDPLGRPRTVTRPDDGLAGGGRTTTTHYLPKKTTVVDPAGHKTVQLVDTYGRTVRTELFANPNDTTPHSYAETTYDGAGRVLTTRQNGDTDTTVTHTYDLLGRNLTTVDPDSGTWTYKYDPAGNLIYQNDPKTGQHIELCYDVLNRPTGKFYYANDTQQSPTCPGNPAIAYFYDDPADYYGKGHLARVRDRSGEVTYRYDARGRVSSEEREITIDGDTTRAEFTYQYDAADRLWKVHYPGGEVVQTDYDSSGQPFAMHSTTGNVTEQIVQCATYDLLGRSMRVQRANETVDLTSYHGTQSGPTRFARDHWLAGRQVQKLDGSATYLNLAYDAYDPRGFVTQVTDHRDASGAQSNSATYGYDFAGRLRTANGPAVNESYGFDPLGNLTQVGSVNLGYGDGSRPHQVTSKTTAGAIKFIQHDTNGNRRAKDDGAQEYTFDEDDRVVEITVDGPPFSAVQVAYDYTGRKTTQVSSGAVNLTTRYYSPLAEVEDDGVTSYYLQYYFFGGQRVASRRTTNTYWELASQGVFEGSVRLAAGSVERPALTVVLGPAAQTAAALGFGGLAFGLVLLPAARRRRAVVGVRLRRRPTAGLTLLWVVATLPWPLVVMPVSVQAGNGQVPFVEWRHYHPDHLGSLQVITNGAALNIENVRYTPYGQIRGRWNADGNPVSLGLTSRHEFTGYETETVSGLEYAGARFYDPVLGSFLTHDPARQFANPYSYVGGNPVNAVDPNGEVADLLFGLLIAFGIGFAVSAIAAAAQGADAGAAFKAGAIGGAIGVATGVGLGLVSQGIASATAGAASAEAIQLGLAGTMSLYGIVESAQSGNVVGLAASVVALAYSISGGYDLLSRGVGSGGNTQGGSGATQQRAAGRPLTANEITEAKKVYGGKIDYSKPKVFGDKYFPLQGAETAMAPDGNIYFPLAKGCSDLTTCTISVPGQPGSQYDILGTFIHEMGHVMQHQQGVNVLGQGFLLQAGRILSGGLYNPYSYPVGANPSQLNIEAQAQYFSDLYCAGNPGC